MTRETLSAKPTKKLTRRDLARQDFEDLMLNPKFLRTLFTILHTAGIFRGNYQPGGRDLGFAEGRRSLGLDILRSAETFGGHDALLRILEAEKQTQKEAPDDDRNDYEHGRDHELGFVGDDDERDVGLHYLDYDAAGKH